MQLNIIRADDSITHVSMNGRLDVQGVNSIQYEFLIQTSVRRKPTLVDLSKVSFIASLGMGMLVSAAKGLERQGARMVLMGPSDLVRHALEAAGIHQVIPIAREEAAALELLRPSTTREDG